MRFLFFINILLFIFLSPLSAQDSSNDDLFGYNQENEQKISSSKNVNLAAFMSIVVPGTGEYYLEHSSCKIFWGIEATLITALLGFEYHASNIENEYIAYAVRNAGINPNDKGRKFFEHIGQYNSRDYYNWYTSLSQHSYDNTYPVNDNTFWNWNNVNDRHHYEDLRVKRDEAKRNAKIVLAFGCLNRLASVVNVFRIGKTMEYSNKTESDFSWYFRPKMEGIYGEKLTWELKLTKTF